MGEVTIFYRPGELGRIVGVSAQTIRTWERQGTITPAVRTMGGHRRFTNSHLQQIQDRAVRPVVAIVSGDA